MLNLRRLAACLALTALAASALNAQPAEEAEHPHVVLLLHGMNSAPDTWDAFLKDIGAEAPNIVKGVLTRKAEARRGVFYYTVKFGAFDVSGGRKGLEEISASGSSSGDFTSFDKLGREVRLAVEGIRERHSGAEILLVGHSRGGNAGREFLQELGGDDAKESVIGFLSLGTPHTGSNLARIHPYLAAHSRADDSSSWRVADLARTLAGLDLRRPTLRDLATESDALDRFNLRVRRLPVADIQYRTIVYSGLPLGKIYGVDLFNIPVIRLSDSCKRYILDGHTPGELNGDGLVAADDQRFDRLPRVREALNLKVTHVSGGVEHTDEPQRTSDILHGMRSVSPWTFRPAEED